ncbi:MAG: helix-turn-helix domain-containing protein [Zetaproteobacteria bacterium]|nr:MAG: helix-turn-helix domain-containing protein [Zetaproteobacteria bacterium]
MQAIGERIKRLREQQGLSQRALAEASGISAAALSQLESGQTSPSVATLEKLADGLGIAVAAFFLEPGEDQDIELFELDDRPSVDLSHGGRFVPLTALRQPTGFEPMLVHLEPGGSFDENQYGIKSPQVFVWMRKGSARLEFDGREYDLHETHSVYYDARKPHNWRNVSDQPTELLMVRSR